MTEILMEHGKIDMDKLIQLLPDGVAVVAVIFVVVLFLKDRRANQKVIQNITTDFANRMEKISNDNMSHVDKLSASYLNNEKEYRTQIQGLFDNFIEVSRGTIIAVKELEATLEVRKQKKDKNEDQK